MDEYHIVHVSKTDMPKAKRDKTLEIIRDALRVYVKLHKAKIKICRKPNIVDVPEYIENGLQREFEGNWQCVVARSTIYAKIS